jgi:hypothetical protein
MNEATVPGALMVSALSIRRQRWQNSPIRGFLQTRALKTSTSIDEGAVWESYTVLISSYVDLFRCRMAVGAAMIEPDFD